jgi:hypothetical protein
MVVLRKTTRVLTGDYWLARASAVGYSCIRSCRGPGFAIDQVFKKFTEIRAVFSRQAFQETNLLIPVAKLIRPIFPTFTHRPNPAL